MSGAYEPFISRRRFRTYSSELAWLETANRFWRGLDHFKAYIWSAVVAHNLVLFARLKPA
jgi:hypothetical protein